MTDRIHDVFTTITATERLKASTKQYLREAYEKRSKQRISPAVRGWGCTACAALVVVLGIGIYHNVSQTPVSYISIDVNPSIELTLNRWDTVILVSPYNDDYAAILEGLSVKGMAYTEAVDLIVESEAMQPFLQDTSALTITVASDSEKKEEKIKTGIEHCAGYQTYGGRSCTSNVAVIDEAHGNGMSFGKYASYLLLSQYDASITLDACRNMKMAEINKLIGQYENSEVQDKPDAAKQREQKALGDEKPKGEPARPQGRKNAAPRMKGNSNGKLIAPDAREIPSPNARPDAAENIRLPDVETDPRKDEPDTDPGLAAPPPAVADTKSQGRHDAPLPNPNASGQAAPDAEPDPPKLKKAPGNRSGQKEPVAS